MWPAANGSGAESAMRRGRSCARRRHHHRLGRLYDDPFDRGWGLEIGYWFARSAWGQGYATDLVSASLAFARERCVPLVSAFARPANGASCRVLEKSGLRLER